MSHSFFFSFVRIHFQMSWGHCHFQGQIWAGMPGRNKGQQVYLWPFPESFSLFFLFIFPPLKVIVDIVGLISTIIFTIFHLVPLFVVSVFVFHAFSAFLWFQLSILRFIFFSFLSIPVICFLLFLVVFLEL